MGRRIPRDLRPFLEEFERRELLSAITDVMAANSLAAGRRVAIGRDGGEIVASRSPSRESRPAGAQPGPHAHGNPDQARTTKRAVRGTICRHLYRRGWPHQHRGDPDVHHGRRHRQHHAALRYSDAAHHSQGSNALARSAASARSSTATSTPIPSLGFDLSAPSQDVDSGAGPTISPT